MAPGGTPAFSLTSACPAGAARCSLPPPPTPTRSSHGCVPRSAVRLTWPRRSRTRGPAASLSTCWPTGRRPRSAWPSRGSSPGGRRDETVLVYLSCHAIRDRARLYFAATDTWLRYPQRSALPAGVVLGELDLCGAGNRLLILDCCFSGGFAEEKGELDLARSLASKAAASPCYPAPGPGSTPTRAGRSARSCPVRSSPKGSRSGWPRAPPTQTETGASRSRRPTTTPTATSARTRRARRRSTTSKTATARSSWPARSR